MDRAVFGYNGTEMTTRFTAVFFGQLLYSAVLLIRKWSYCENKAYMYISGMFCAMIVIVY